MEIYLVGGAVRDKLLGIEEVHDRDYVVVGSTEAEMFKLGYTKVGKQFPVYLHPDTKEEYALARTERSTGPGHNDFEMVFTPDVTLEEDLIRRDLTINAIALNMESGEYVDPYNGMQDMENKIIRATSDHFMEDPLRVLRLCRFHAKLGDGWEIDRVTKNMCRTMVDSGMLNALTPERVWGEFEKILDDDGFPIFLADLQDLGFLNIFSPEIAAQHHYCDKTPKWHPESNILFHTVLTVNCVSLMEGIDDYNLSYKDKAIMRFVMLVHDIAKVPCLRDTQNTHDHDSRGVQMIADLCEKWHIPNEYRDPAMKFCKHHINLHGIFGLSSNKIRLMVKDFGKHLPIMALCGMCDKLGIGRDTSEDTYEQAYFLLSSNDVLNNLDKKAISRKMLGRGVEGEAIGNAIMEAEINTIKALKRSDEYKHLVTTKR